MLHSLIERLVELVHMPESLVQLGNLCLLHPVWKLAKVSTLMVWAPSMDGQRLVSK